MALALIRAALAATFLLFATGCATMRVERHEARSGRSVHLLDRGWKFRFGEAEDAAWVPVNLPHSWNALGEYRLDRSDRVDKRTGAGWYELKLDPARLVEGKRHFLQFDGVGNVADLWVNGVHVGRHAGAFSRFRFDITGALRREGPNIIRVRADNSDPAPNSSTAHVIPLLGDFFVHGGLYRAVSLVSVEPAHIDLLDHGGPGIYARTIAITPASATVEVTARLRNQGAAPRDLALAIRIEDAEGRTAAKADAPVRLPASAATELVRSVTLPSPRLWNGRADPYLYRLVTELRDGTRVIDRVTEPLGIRSFHIDPDKGFFLNGRHLPLRGVSRHQDWLGKGWAIGPEEHARDMALIAEMGANAVRFAHYQHDGAWFDAADKAGMAVWAELPFVNKLSFGNVEASPELVANARQQMIELIRQNYNHPSVVTWGIGNEVDIDLAFGRLGPRADARPLLDVLHRLAKREDPGRPTVIADCCEATPGDKVDYLPVLAGHADLMGYNRYFGWYYGTVDDLGPHMDMLHARHPAIPISISEYGAGGAVSQHTDNPEGGPINTSGRPHPEEFQSWWHERSWPQLARRRYLWANWIWNMFDFSSRIRQEGDATDINDKGLVTFDRKVRKDAFFYYKANWSAEPVVHITSRRYVDRAYPVADIRLYSNAPSVQVKLNGRTIGDARCSGGICVLRDVAFDPGVNRVSARADFAAGPVTDSVVWNAPDAADGIGINAGDLSGLIAQDGARIGSDNWFAGGIPKRLSGEAAQAIGDTGDRRLLHGYREGRFSYSIPLPDGRWRVSLLFIEPDKASRRSFDVVAQGRAVLRGFAPLSAAGAPLRAVERSFAADVRNGRLDLRFIPREGEAIVSAIRIRPLR